MPFSGYRFSLQRMRAMPQQDNEPMTLDEVSLRAALNVLRDSVESRRMPRGCRWKARAWR